MGQIPNFESCFEALTGHSPMRWQERLFERMLTGDLPAACDLATGLGKTSVIPIWLIALASQSRDSAKLQLPRRLVYIVNRRTVVDQATQVVETMHLRLQSPEEHRWTDHQKTLLALAEKLRGLAAYAHNEVLGVSTLRGELADNEQWKADPARPAIVVGTIDMVGSKLLFCGYGDGRYMRTHHAGLIGQDVLIVHDEAHLTPAFDDLLRAVVTEQRREVEGNGREDGISRPIRVISLSATSRENERDIFTLVEEDRKDRIVQDRLEAGKRLHLHPVPEDKVVERIVLQCKEHESARARVLIYVRSPEQARKIDEELAKTLGTDARGRIALLTGTIRGYERDLLMRKPPECAAAQVIRHFLDGTQPERSEYLISTSAGEVGIDLDADHMVCDLTTLDALVQRLGRVNRRGGKDRHASVDVVGNIPAKEKPSELDKALAATSDILKGWIQQFVDGVDVSPGSLRRHIETLDAEARNDAFSPRPEALPLTDIIIDGWTLTSLKEMPGRPEVAPYLHGIAEWEPPETFVAWRADLGPLARAGISERDLEEIFDVFPLRTAERLRDHTDRVLEQLAAIAKRLREDPSLSEQDRNPKVVLHKQNVIKWVNLSDLTPEDKQDKVGAISKLAFATVILPVEAGGLRQDGTLDGKEKQPGIFGTLDVAEASDLGKRHRQRLLINADESETPLIGGTVNINLAHHLRISLTSDEAGSQTGLAALEYRVDKGEATESGKTVTLKDHACTIEAVADRMGRALGLNEAILKAVVISARWHDKGKDRLVWQRYARNDGADEPIAKASRYLHPRTLGGYRHEFGSLLDAMSDTTIQRHPERDLVLHLIAAHHGWARPHLEICAFDHEKKTTSENEKAAVEVLRRFERLQRRFGRWGLAWLESLVRCADIAASKAAADDAVPALEGQEVSV